MGSLPGAEALARGGGGVRATALFLAIWLLIVCLVPDAEAPEMWSGRFWAVVLACGACHFALEWRRKP